VYPPRRAGLDALWSGLAAGRAGSLHGCLAGVRRDTLWIAREPAAVRDGAPLWDGRFRIDRAEPGRVAPLGEAGLAALRAAARTGEWTPPAGWAACPRPARLASPALWREDRLACAPLAAYGEGLQVSWTGTLPYDAAAR
jgi:tRNA(Ile)-lysidine synthase